MSRKRKHLMLHAFILPKIENKLSLKISNLFYRFLGIYLKRELFGVINDRKRCNNFVELLSIGFFEKALELKT